MAKIDSLEKEALDILRALSENELRDAVMKPFFEGEGWEVEVVDRKGELGHDCDLLLSRGRPGEEEFHGVQLKAAPENISTRGYVKRRIRPCALTALSYFPRADSRWRLTRYYWITTGEIAAEGHAGIRAIIDGEDATRGRVEIWSGKALVRQLNRPGALRAIDPLRLVYAQSQIQRHQGIFAAHWAYRAFRLQLLKPSPDIEKALAHLECGLTCIAEDRYDNMYSYYRRSFKRVFSSWQILLRERKDLISESEQKLETIVAQPGVKDFFASRSTFGINAVMLLQDFELSFRQLAKLEARYVDGPTRLSTLVICRLLLRFGFSPNEPNLTASLDRMTEHLNCDWEPARASIDDGCSLCTGVLLSCLSLARRQDEDEFKDQIQRIRNWLLSLSAYRFSHRSRSDESSPHEHGLHYASQTFLGLLDLDSSQDESLAPVLDVFFQPSELEWSRDLWRDLFYLEWVRYSHIDRFEVYRFILSTFLRFFLMGKDLPSERQDRLRLGIRALAQALKEDRPETQRTSLFHPTRVNLPSLVLGLWMGVSEATDLALDVVRLHHRRALIAAERRDDQLWDSNIESTVSFIEGLLDYWETIIDLEDRGQDVLDLLPGESTP